VVISDHYSLSFNSIESSSQ